MAAKSNRNGFSEGLGRLWNCRRKYVHAEPGQVSIHVEVCTFQGTARAEIHRQRESKSNAFRANFHQINLVIHFHWQCIQYKTEIMPDLKKIEKLTGNLMMHMASNSNWCVSHANHNYKRKINNNQFRLPFHGFFILIFLMPTKGQNVHYF